MSRLPLSQDEHIERVMDENHILRLHVTNANERIAQLVLDVTQARAEEDRVRAAFDKQTTELIQAMDERNVAWELMREAARCLHYAGPAVHEMNKCTATYEECILADCCEPRMAEAEILAALSKGKP